MIESNMVLHVSFRPNTSLKDSLKESQQKCQEFNLAAVEFKYQGTEFYVTAESDLDFLYEAFHAI